MMTSRVQVLFSGLYSSQFILLGVQLPFFSGWLALNGFSAPEIGWITGIALGARLLFGPLVAFWADGLADDRLALRVISATFAIGAVGLWLEPGKLMIGLSAALVLWSFGVLAPLSDSAAIRADEAGLLNYGHIRAIGSFAFLLTTLIGGMLLSRFGIEWSVSIMAAAGLSTFLFAFALPRSKKIERPSSRDWREAPKLMASVSFLLMILAAGLTQGSHAVYYTFSILHWSDLGYSESLVGALWAVGVGAEIVLLTRARRLAAKFSPVMMIGVGGFAAAMRWFITAMEPSIAVLFVVQLLHAFTFAASYLGSIEFIRRAVPGYLVNTAMTLTSTTGVGAFVGIATIGAGYLFAAYGPAAAYYLMSAMGAGAVILSFILAKRIAIRGPILGASQEDLGDQSE